jgi:hypothetical protein
MVLQNNMFFGVYNYELSALDLFNWLLESFG